MILAKDIIQMPSPILRRRAKKVHFPLSKTNRTLAKILMQYLEVGQNPKLAQKYNIMGGVGIAAPQVNVSERMAAVLVPNKVDESSDQPLFKAVLINPVITSQSKQKCALITGEGCLSVNKDVPGLVHRAKKISLRYQDVKGVVHHIHLIDYPAIVCQHEIMHLHGKLFYDFINHNAPYSKIPHETLIDLTKNKRDEFGKRNQSYKSTSYRAVRIRSYKQNESLTKATVLKMNHK